MSGGPAAGDRNHSPAAGLGCGVGVQGESGENSGEKGGGDGEGWGESWEGNEGGGGGGRAAGREGKGSHC